MKRKQGIRWWHAGLALALLLAVLSPLASTAPDGLKSVAENNGFWDKAFTPAFNVMSGYIFQGIANQTIARVFAAITGTILLFLVGYGLASLLKKRNGL